MDLEIKDELVGLFTAEKSADLDNLVHGAYADKLFYNGFLTDGGLTAVAKSNAKVLVSATQNGESRVIAHTVDTENGGKISWCRGSDCSRKATDADDSVKNDTTINGEFFPVEILLRAEAEDMGFTVKIEKLDLGQ